MTQENSFPDRRDRFFGREGDVKHLLDRAKNQGITGVAGRPKMGKTWLLEETARRLSIGGKYLVGYHESRAQSADMRLRSVSDLYTRWLANAGMCQQAKSLWERHKDKWVTKVGEAVGLILDSVASLPNLGFKSVGELVRNSFDGLASVDRDLRTGGLELKPLDYDQAHELVTIIAEISGKPLVLILDAWEQSPGLKFEHRTLDMFLSHLEDWPSVHVFLGIRQPHLDDPRQGDPAYDFAKDLSPHPAAELHDLEPMKYDLPERDRLLAYLREQVPITKNVRDDTLLELIGGFPGVVGYWVDSNKNEEITSEEKLRAVADDAQKYRYRELDKQLSHLAPDERTLAIRLAMLPRMDTESWSKLKGVVLDGLDENLCDELYVKKVLEGIDPPTYGHDTRHKATRDWFTTEDEFRSLAKQETEAIIRRLANRFRRADEENRPFGASLLGLRALVGRLELGDEAHALCDAASSQFLGLRDQLDWTAFDNWWSQAAPHSPAGAALLAQAVLSRGFEKGRAGDTGGEMADYTAVIAMPDAPAEQKAKALFNRGVVKGQAGDTDGALADYTAVIDMSNAPAEPKAKALLNRGITKGQVGDTGGAMANYTAVIEMPDAPAEQKAKALLNRGIAKGRAGDTGGEMADYTAVIAMPDAPAEQKAKALFARGITKGQAGDTGGEMADFTAVINMPDAQAELKGAALLNRGGTKRRAGDTDGAMADYTAVIDMPDAPAEQKAKALFARGITKGQAGDTGGEMADYTTVIEMPDAPAEQKAEALVNRGVVKRRAGDTDGAMADFTAVIDMPDAQAELKGAALLNRGGTKRRAGDTDGAMADYTAVIDMPDAPAEQKAKALVNRGITKGEAGDTDGAMADYTAVIDMPDAPAELKAEARKLIRLLTAWWRRWGGWMSHRPER